MCIPAERKMYFQYYCCAGRLVCIYYRGYCGMWMRRICSASEIVTFLFIRVCMPQWNNETRWHSPSCCLYCMRQSHSIQLALDGMFKFVSIAIFIIPTRNYVFKRISVVFFANANVICTEINRNHDLNVGPTARWRLQWLTIHRHARSSQRHRCTEENNNNKIQYGPADNGHGQETSNQLERVCL